MHSFTASSLLLVCASILCGAATLASASTEDNRLLKEPCSLTTLVTRYTDRPTRERPYCRLEGDDAAVHGHTLLKIPGLTTAWMKEHHVRPKQPKLHTLFLEGAVINLNSHTLELPDGETIDSMLIDYLPGQEDDSRLLKGLEPSADTLATRAALAGGRSEEHGRELQSMLRDSTGEKTFFILRVLFSGGESVPLQSIKDEVLNSDPTFMDQFAAVSYNKLTFTAKDTAGSVGGIADMDVGIDISESTSLDITISILEELNTTIDIYDDFDHFLLLFPYGTVEDDSSPPSTEWVAYAESFGKVSVYNGDVDFPDQHYAFNNIVVLHEIGHNMGLDHANEFDEEYGDISGVMGSSDLIGSELKGFNGAKSWELGWYADQAIVLVPGADIDYTTRLCGVVDYNPSDTSYKVLIRIDDPNSILNYVVSFNRASGFNADSGEGRDAVLVMSFNDILASEEDDDFSNLEAKLGSGQVHTINESSSTLNGLRIIASQIDTDTTSPMCATVRVLMDNSVSPTLMPSSSSAPTTGCRAWTNARAPLFFFDDSVLSFRFDVDLKKDVDIFAMRLVLPGDSDQPYTIYFRNSTWFADGGWTQIAAGTIKAKGGDDFTDVITFDQPLALLATDGTIALRVDTATKPPDKYTGDGQVPHPEEDLDCPNCPFQVKYGRSSSDATDFPDGILSSLFDPFLGTLMFCDPASSMPSFVPTPLPSSSPSARPSISPSASPSMLPTDQPSSNATFAPTSVPTSVPTSAPTSSAPGLSRTKTSGSVWRFAPWVTASFVMSVSLLFNS